MDSPIGRIIDVSIDSTTGHLVLENVAGERLMLDNDLRLDGPVTSATLTERCIVATDGTRVVRYDGLTIIDVTDQFKPC